MSTVLVVDDHPDLCDVLTRILRRSGFAAECVSDGAAALDFVRETPPRLVILDVMMPGLSGFDVLIALRSDPATAGIPVVMYSAVSDPAARERAVALGAREYLLKGRTNLDEIRGTVARYAGPPQ